jgi:Pentapeptide repeats (8 copies)
MRNPWRHILALLWLLAMAGGALGLLRRSATGAESAALAAVSQGSCRPEKSERCVTEQHCIAQKRTFTSEQIEEQVRRHRRWLTMVDAKVPIAPDQGKADLSNANLQRIDLSQKDLRWADMTCSSLANAQMTYTNLAGANMACADMRNANLKRAHLEGADLTRARMCNANLYETHLESATLIGANFEGASFSSAKMQYAYLGFSTLAGSHLDIDPSSLPLPESMQWVDNLDQVQLGETYSPAGLYKLRDQLKNIGLRDQEKQITAAIRRAQMAEPGHTGLEREFNYLLFDKTCEYGKEPGRALKAFVFCLLSFAVIYIFAQMMPSVRSGIWAVWDRDRIHEPDGHPEGKVRLTEGFPRSKYADKTMGKTANALGLNVLGLALWFSLLSATQIGWQAFNFGTWFSRIQPREYSLRATGWVRVAAGIQSLISVYFVALWLATYFGTPFE